MAKEKILIVGSGGREHALAWKLAQNENVSCIFCAPGNGGTYLEEKVKNVNIDGSKVDNFQTLYNLIQRENIDLTIVGPEISLANGIVDFLNSKGYNRVFGPNKTAAKLESDKFFSYNLMQELGIPQADSIKCYSIDEAIKALEKRPTNKGVVIKARGLSFGKGVAVCDTKEQALGELQKNPQKYGSEVLIAERLIGEEFSVFGLSDGSRVYPFNVLIKDYKRIYDKDLGPNTGGMGSFGPVYKPFNKLFIDYITENIMNPVVQKIKSYGFEYKGILYAGMIITKEGMKVLEFNARFGDPECQSLVMLVDDLYEPIYLSVYGGGEIKISHKKGDACCAVLASKGYPEKYETGRVIFGLDAANKIRGIKIFHAGTKFDKGKLLTAGGRVLAVTAYSKDGLGEARKKVYKASEQIRISGGFHYRKDIGLYT